MLKLYQPQALKLPEIKKLYKHLQDNINHF